jgi:hypothetical protein
VAALVLEDPRVVRIIVRVEKLEIGPGGVGVEIERTRAKDRVAAVPSPLPTAATPPAGKKGAAS